MKFTGPLDPTTAARVQACDQNLTDPARLEALRRTGLMDTPSEEAFDRLAYLAAKILKVPLTIISLVGDKKQFFKAGYGLPAPYDTLREVPIGDSICRYTLHMEPIIAADSSQHELLKLHPTIGSWGITAFTAIPMVTEDGHVLGAFCAVDSKVRPWSDDDIMVMTELTKSVMIEISLRGRISELQLERTWRDRFVATLTHDLRNPLSVAKMGAQVIGELDGASEERSKFVKMIVENVDRADKMIQDILDANRLKAGEKLSVEKTECSLNEVLNSAVESLESVYGERFVVQASEQISGLSDVNHLRRMIENLVGNAVKYGAFGRPIQIGLKRQGTFAEISIHNEGNPIPPQDLANLFELFQRSESAVKSSQKGWGIGLAVVSGLTEALQGRLQVESSAEAGTIFTILLPI